MVQGTLQNTTKKFFGTPYWSCCFCLCGFIQICHIYIYREEDDNEEEYTEGESGDDPRGAKKIEKKMKIYENWQWVSFEREMECDKLEN